MVNDLIVVKANSLIEASYRLSIDEIRILALTIGTMNPKSDQKIFDFTIADFVREFPEISMDNAYKQIQVAIKRIYDRSVRTEDRNRVTEFRWVSSRTYFKKEGRFRIAMTDEVMPYLTQLKGQFTQYQLKHIAYFNSVYSIRIYELITQYKSMGEREIFIDDLKKWLQVEDKYPRFNSFNQRVLEPAIAEINEKSDLVVTVELIKRGRKIVALKFQMTNKTNNKKQENTPKLNGMRKIHGVFLEKNRPQVAEKSKAEYDWALENLSRAKQQLKDLGLIPKEAVITDYLLETLPTEWLEVLGKYYHIVDHYTSRDIYNILYKRKEQEN